MKQAKKWHSLVCVPFTPLSNRSPYETMLEWWSSDGERVLVSVGKLSFAWDHLGAACGTSDSPPHRQDNRTCHRGSDGNLKSLPSKWLSVFGVRRAKVYDRSLAVQATLQTLPSYCVIGRTDLIQKKQ